MSEELRDPRWEYDCRRCKFNWTCGPLCCCVPGLAPSRKYRCWQAKVGTMPAFPVEVTPPFPEVGEQVKFREFGAGAKWETGRVTETKRLKEAPPEIEVPILLLIERF